MTARTIISEVHTPSQTDFDRFARISGDDNPIHVDPAFAARTRFGRTVAHGMFLSSILWSVIRRHLPQTGRQLTQELKFPNPAFAGEALRFAVTVQDNSALRVALAFSVARVSDGTVTCEGYSEFEIRNERS